MMTKTQCLMAAEMLNMAQAEFGNHGCNDFELEATPENLEFVRGMIAASDYPEDEPNLSEDGAKIYTTDWMVMAYCKTLLMQNSV